MLLPSDAADFSSGRDAVEFAESIGYELLDWQSWLIEQLLAERVGGGWAAPQAGVVIPRQNGKNVVLEVIELYGLYVQGLKSQIHTAHEADTAALHMAELKGRIEGDDDLSAITSVFESNGKERIVNRETGGVLSFRTRTKKVKRGASPQRVVFDEALYCDDRHISALVPAMSAQSMDADTLPHMVFTSSAPLEESIVLHRLRRQCLEQQIPRMLWAEWSADADVSASDVDAWYATNPSLGLLISEDYVRDSEFVLMADQDFKAERLGVPKFPSTDDDMRPISLARWAVLIDTGSSIVGDVSTAIDVSPDLKWSTVASAGLRSDGHIHVEVGRRQPGTEWVVPFAKANPQHGPYRVAGSSPAGFLLSLLAEADVDTVDVPAGDVTQACARLITAVDDGTIHHLGSNEIAAALSNATITNRGDARTWSRVKSSGDISALVAATIAVGGVTADGDDPQVWF